MTPKPETQPLLVIGGWGVNAAMLGPVATQWPGPVRFVSLDDRLLASSHTVAEAARTLVLQYPEPSVWLGWSQGAQVAMAAADIPGTPVQKVVTLAGFPRFVAGDDWPTGMAPETFEAFRRGMAADPNRTWRRFQQLLVHGVARAQSATARRELGRWLADGPVANSEHLEHSLDSLAREDQRTLWRTLDQPTLHLLAEADALVRPWSEDLALPERATVKIIPDMSHWPSGDKAAQCGRILGAFAVNENASEKTPVAENL
jgi:pimeloyl-[acyl-carrier protein] methyl ester esterase